MILLLSRRPFFSVRARRLFSYRFVGPGRLLVDESSSAKIRKNTQNSHLLVGWSGQEATDRVAGKFDFTRGFVAMREFV